MQSIEIASYYILFRQFYFYCTSHTFCKNYFLSICRILYVSYNDFLFKLKLSFLQKSIENKMNVSSSMFSTLFQ